MKAFRASCVVLSLVLASVVPAPALADQNAEKTPPRFAGFRLYEENDSIFTIGGDERYTQGLRFEFDIHPDRTPGWAKKDWSLWWLRRKLQLADYSLAFVLGQNLYTPRMITTRVPEPNDRGFTDLNYLGTSHTALSANKFKRSQLEVLVGWMGVRDLSNGAQGGLHALREHRMPRGWETTKPTGARFHISSRFDLRTDPKSRCYGWLCVDATAGYGVEAGLVRNGVNGRTVLRIGRGLSGFPAGVQYPAVVDDRKYFEFGAYGGLDARLLAHTSLVKPTPGSVDFKQEHGVFDLVAGAFVRVGALRLTIQPGFVVRRSSEFSNAVTQGRAQHFTSAQVSYEPIVGETNEMPCLLRHLKIELGMGSSVSALGATAGSGKGLVNHLAGRRRIYGKNAWTLEAGVERTSLALATTPTPGEPGNTSNLFVGQVAGSLGLTWEPKDATLGLLGLRVGRALRTNASTETVFHPTVNGRLEEDPVGETFANQSGGWLLGAQYYFPLERHVSLGFDVTHHRLKVAPTVPFIVGANYWRFTFGLQLRTLAAEATKKAATK